MVQSIRVDVCTRLQQESDCLLFARLIQQKLEVANEEQKQLAFKQVLQKILACILGGMLTKARQHCFCQAALSPKDVAADNRRFRQLCHTEIL